MPAFKHRPGRRFRPAFTLVELLAVILVISILASTVLFALWGAAEEAKEARTRTQITKINQILMTRWEGYRTRPIRLRNLPASVRQNPRSLAQLKLHALRDLMRMEMPDRKTDIMDPPAILMAPNVQIAEPSIHRRWRTSAPASWDDTYSDSECLYLILESIREDGRSAASFLHENEVGDTDNDGMKEVLDAWGNPILFIRWPAGHVAHPGADGSFGTGDDIPSYSNLQVEDPAVAPDPFDPLKVDPRHTMAPYAPSTTPPRDPYQFNFALFPLISSAGVDGDQDIVRLDFDPSTTPPTILTPDTYRYYRGSGTAQFPQNDPYGVLPTSQRRPGEPFVDSGGYADNITNHNIEIR